MEVSFDDLLSFDIEQDSTTAILKSLKSYGCAKVSNLLPRDLVEAAADCVAGHYDDAEARWNSGQMDEREYTYTLSQGILRPLEFPMAFKPNLDFAAFMLNTVTNSPVSKIAAALFGPDLSLIQTTTCVRRQKVETKSTHLPFHQDSGAHESLNDARVMNCWVALTSAGTDAPGIEVVPINLGGMLPKTETKPNQRTTKKDYAIWSTNAGFMSRIFTSDAYWRPKCEPGDALLMLSHTLHRTHVAPEMTKPRYAFEVRLTSKATTDRIAKLNANQKSRNTA